MSTRRVASAFLAPLTVAGGFAWSALSAVGCLQQVSTGTGTSDPGTMATTGASSSNSVPSGANCGTDPQSQVTLCEQSSACPSLLVDQSALPGCGFRLRPGAVIDLECLCADALCPIGVADSCGQAKQLLSSQTSLSVCQQASDGRCVPLASPEAGAATPSGACDKTCESACAGEPSCIQLCGC